MRIDFDDVRRPARMSKLLRAAFAAQGIKLGLSGAQDVCAKLYGYPTYHELKASCGRRVASPWDEACPSGVAESRRGHQQAVLRETGFPAAAAEAFLDACRPTGASPRRPTIGRGGARFDAAFLEREARKGSLGRDGLIALEDLVDAPRDHGHVATAEGLLRRVLGEGASDIHVEPMGDGYRVHARDVSRPNERTLMHAGPRDEYDAVVAYIKGRSKMDPAELSVGQDGRMWIECAGRNVELRVATIPGVEGEHVVVRAYDPGRPMPGLDRLAVSDARHWIRGILNEDGLCLVCGEAGSGKTTALNASMRELDRFEKKIYSLEGSVEYRIPYVGQVSMSVDTGRWFGQPSRSFMRPDPDVMVMGEIRDADSAADVMRAAEAGHLVIVTIGLPTAREAVARLLALGMAPSRLRYVLRAVLRLASSGDAEGPVCIPFRTQGDVDAYIARLSDTDGQVPPVVLDDAIARMRAGQVTSGQMRLLFGQAFDSRMAVLGLDPDDYGSLAA